MSVQMISPVHRTVEYRLYYDEQGKVLFYTCDDAPGEYIVVDQMTFIEARQDVRVIDGVLIRNFQEITVSKLMPSTTGQACAKDDITVVVNNDYIDKQYWKVTTYAPKHH